MNRRGFLSFVAAAPVAVPALALGSCADPSPRAAFPTMQAAWDAIKDAPHICAGRSGKYLLINGGGSSGVFIAPPGGIRL